MMKSALCSIVLCVLVSSPAFGQETKACICPMYIEPVCGSNAQTYTNPCFFECARKQQSSLTIFSQGPCPDKEEAVSAFVANPAFEEEDAPKCMCSMDYRPVCGSDRKTYGNPCVLNCAREKNPKLALATHGECPELRKKTRLVLPNAPATVPKLCTCTREYRPVCASNSVTYGNKCLFECAKKTIMDLSIVREGSC